jgi:hypothetical protein
MIDGRAMEKRVYSLFKGSRLCTASRVRPRATGAARQFTNSFSVGDSLLFLRVWKRSTQMHSSYYSF